MMQRKVLMWEEVLFEDRAKLYRFVDQEWKERGLGIVKILHHNSSGRVRLLMRREQVLKVCANHYVTPNMEIHPLKNSDRAWTWVAQDFADEELKPEHFCIRFKTPELAAAFKAAFIKAVNIAKDSETKNLSSSKVTIDGPVISKSFGMKFVPKAGSWTCPTCYVCNGAENFCIACEAVNPFLVPNAQSVAITVSSNASISTFSSKTSLNDKPFTFNIGGVQSDSSPLSSKISVTTSSTAKSIFGGFTFSSSPTICETESPEAKDREILVVSTKSKNGPQVSKVTPTSSPFSTFSFGKSPVSSNVTVQISGNTRTVTTADEKTAPFGSVLSKPLFPVTSSNVQSSTVTSSSNENSLSKMQAMVQNISPTFESKDPSKNANLTPVEFSKQPDLPFSSTISSNVSKLSTDNSPEEFVPTAEFKPVVPLPALVEVKTGEEKEEVVFEERAKLFRYDSDLKEWKERGTGVLKILYLKETKKYRILMRRDQVLKICANHNIIPEMKLSPLPSNDKSWVWFAQDYSDGDFVQEKFAARFKNAEIAQKFQRVFENCQEALKSVSNENLCGISQEAEKLVSSENVSDASNIDKCAGNSEAFDQLFKLTANSWNCSNCHKANMNESSCVYCKTPKTNSVPKQENATQKPLSELFKPAAGSWECKNCFVRNKSTVSICVSCETHKPNTFKLDQNIVQQDVLKSNSIAASSITEPQKSLADMFKPKPGSWECQSCYVRNDADKTECASCDTPKSGPKALSTIESNSIFGKFQFGSSDANAPTFQFGKPKASEFVFGMRPVAQPTTFSFGHSTISNKENETSGFRPAAPESNSPAVFGGVIQKTLSEKNDSVKTTSTPIFGSFSSSFTFGSSTIPPKSDSESVEFQFGSPQKYEFNFTGVRPRSPTKTPKSPRSPGSPSDVDDEEGSDYEADNIYFQPAIPLPPKVDVVTGEEDENVLYCQRAKLFRFSSGEWKERGIGDIKILFDDKTRKIRLLMRREQVLKVCLNHYLTKDLKFEKRGDKSWSWTATDFSENEPSPEILAVRFKTNELTVDFKNAIDDALKKMESQPPISSDKTVSKSGTLFSFKSDSTTPSKVESNFNSSSLSSRFGTVAQDKPVFGSNSFNFPNSKGNSPFTFSFQNKAPATSTFFSQPSSVSKESPQTKKDGVTFTFGSSKETEVDDDIMIVYEAIASADKIAAAEKLKLPKNFYLYEKKPCCLGCIGCKDIIPPHKDLSAEEPKEISTVTEEPSKSSTAGKGSNVPFCSSKFASFSFADLASKASSESMPKPSSNKNIFAGAGAPVFSNLNTSTEDTDEVVQNSDIHFEPVIPLPDLIEVKTGEEDEFCIFAHRAKLFRFDIATKQWKERGVGDIKILSHKEKIRFRIILRRDQVHNVACNHVITKDMSLSPMVTSENALCWNALDFSDGPDGEASQFAVRFKLKETLNQFKQVFDNCKEKLANQGQENTPVKETVSDLNSATSANIVSSPNDSGTKPATKNNLNVDNHTPEGIKQESESDSDKGSEDDEAELLFEKRATLEIFNEAENKFKNEGVGCLKITYDDAVYGYHIVMIDDKGRTMCDHIIAVQTCLRAEGKKAIWAALDMSVEPVTRRQFRATFSSLEALKEFSKCFEEGKEIAIKSEIIEKAD